jgi:hypothetical protein
MKTGPGSVATKERVPEMGNWRNHFFKNRFNSPIRLNTAAQILIKLI